MGDEIWLSLSLYLGPGLTIRGAEDVLSKRFWLLRRRRLADGGSGLTASTGGIHADVPAIDSDWPSPALAADHNSRRDALLQHLPPGGHSVGLVGAVWGSSHGPERAGAVPAGRFRVTRLRLVDAQLGPAGEELPSPVPSVRERERVEPFETERVGSDFLGRRWRYGGVLIDVCPAR